MNFANITEAQKIYEKIISAQKIGIISHQNPDGDCLGSQLGLAEFLISQEKKVKTFCCDPAPDSFCFLPGSEKIFNNLDLNCDLLIFVDCGNIFQTGFADVLKNNEIFSINFDHHPDNPKFGDLNLVLPKFSSTTAILTKFFIDFDFLISPQVATCFLTGIFTDTGSFQHSNADSNSHRLAAKLLSRGANLEIIRQEVFKTKKISTLKLWGKVLSRAQFSSTDLAIFSIVKDLDFEKTKANPKDIGGAIDFLNMVPEANFSFLLTEKDGSVKGSFRARGEKTDVQKIAKFFGGGGHKKAAGFTIPGKLKREVRWKIIQ